MMSNHYSLAIQKNMDLLWSKNNAYIRSELRLFIENHLSQINQLGLSLHLPQEDIEALQLAYLHEIMDIDFMKAYLGKQLGSCGELGFEIEPEVLTKFIYKHKPVLHDINDFFVKNGMFEDKLHTLTMYIEKIKKIINSYGNSNKNHLVAECAIKLEMINQSMKQRGYEEISEVHQEVGTVLADLQRKENAYYDGLRFFSQSRKNNSSLQSRITAATETWQVMPRSIA